EQTITDHLKFGNSADWGFHVLGSSPMWQYQISAENGRGYGNPTRSKSVDFEGRLSFTPVKGLDIAVGGYSRQLGKETDAAPAKHTATRTDALISYRTDLFHVGAEYYESSNWTTVTSALSDKASGWSSWGQWIFNPAWMAFVRYDDSDPSKTQKPKLN